MWLQTGAHEFADAPTAETLATLQEGWRWARTPWKRTDAFRFGPTSVGTLAVAIDQSPIDPAKIDAEIAGAATLDAAYFDNLGANKKGFHGIEYLIFGADDAAVLALFTTDVNAVRRRAFVAGAADHLVASALRLQAAWIAQAALLADPGADNTDYPNITASIDALVNESVFQVEVVADTRIGKPLGTQTGGTPHPELQESAPSGLSLADMTGTLESIRNIYFGSRDGTPGKGIGKLVHERSPVTDRDVHTALDAAFAAIAAIPPPYTQALLDGRPEVLAAYNAVQDLRHVLATEVIATLGATLKFNANDGD
jgi:predicted lipoprotein